MIPSRWFKSLPFNKDISFSDIPPDCFDWFIWYYEQEKFYSYGTWVKIIDNEFNDGFIKIKYKNRL